MLVSNATIGSNWKTCPTKGQMTSYLPVSSHPPCQLITTPFCLHKNNSLVLLFTHYFLKQTNQSDKEETKEVLVRQNSCDITT